MSSILISPSEPVIVQPDGPDGRSYILRTPKHLERPRYRHAVASVGGRRWGQLDMTAALKVAIAEMLPDEEDAAERERLTAAVSEHEAGIKRALDDYRRVRSDETTKAVAEAMVAPPLVVEIDQTALRHHEDYATKVADRMVYRELAGIAAARMFLTGWEAAESEAPLPPFRRGLTGVADGLLDLIPTRHFIAIGDRAEELIDPPERMLGNSESESPGPSTESDSEPLTATRKSARSKTVTASS